MSEKIKIFLSGAGEQSIDVEPGMTVGQLKTLINGHNLVVRDKSNGTIVDDSAAVSPGGSYVGTPQGKGG